MSEEKTMTERPHWLHADEKFNFARSVKHQTVELEGGVRRNAQSPHQLIKGLPQYNTACDFLKVTADQLPTNPCLGVRAKDGDAYEWETYSEVVERSEEVKRALLAHGLEAGDKVGIWAVNQPRWVYVMQATYAAAMVNVAVYPTFGDEELKHVVNDSAMAILFVDPSQTERVGEMMKDFAKLKTIVVMSGDGQATVATTSKGTKGPQVMEWEEFMEGNNKKKERKEEEGRPVKSPTPADLAAIIYTSGSTGMPKGVLLTHGNLAAATGAAVLQLQPSDGTFLHYDNVYFSYLPLAHSFERVALSAMFTIGAAVGFFSGDTKKLAEDAQALHPTWMPCAPRVFDKVYQLTMKKLEEAGVIARAIFWLAYYLQLFAIVWFGRRLALLDSLVFNRIKNQLGGRLVRVLSGGSPLSKRTYDFMRVCFCDKGIQQGYGLTETAAATSFMYPEDHELSVGTPCPSVEVKLAPCKESDELKSASRDVKHKRCGEILIRGPSLFVGYNNQEDKYNEDVDDDGWFKTGDIGCWNENGSLSVVDRRKNYLKLSQGEFVSPEQLEETYSKCPLVEQIFIAADPSWSALLAVVRVKGGGAGGGKKKGNTYEDDKVRKEVVEALNKTASAAGLRGFEKIADVLLTEDEWTPENDLATPTFKVKRGALMERYEKELEEMASKQK